MHRQKVDPIYYKMLAAAAAIFVIGVSVMLSDMYNKIGRIEDELFHIQSKSGEKGVCLYK